MSDTTPGIDPRSPRFGAAITTVLLAATIGLTLIPATYTVGIVLLAVIVVFFAVGGIGGIRRHPYGALFRRFVRPRLGPPDELEAPEPPTFAQQVGLFVTGIALLLALVASRTPHPSVPPSPSSPRSSTPSSTSASAASSTCGWSARASSVRDAPPPDRREARPASATQPR